MVEELGLSRRGKKKLLKLIKNKKINPKDTDEVKGFAKKFKRRSWIRRIVLCVIGVILVLAGVFAVRSWVVVSGAVDGVFAGGGGVLDLVRRDPLQKDENGRTNVLFLGAAGEHDDEHRDHPSPGLTSSMMVLSFHEETSELIMISVPRDMEVRHECDGWLGTTWGKFNQTFPCIEEAGGTFERAAEVTKTSVGDVLGLEVHYLVHMDFRVLIDVVDTLGGIDVEIWSSDPLATTIMDRNFDWMCPAGPYTCHFVHWPVGEVAHLDGTHALALSRARGAAGGWGLPRANFDREVHQQRIFVAVGERAQDVNFFVNPGTALDLIEAMGAHIRTTFRASEFRTLVELAQSVTSEGDVAGRVRSLPLLNYDQPEYSVVDGAGQPLLGQFNFSGIRELVRMAIMGELEWLDEENGDVEELL